MGKLSSFPLCGLCNLFPSLPVLTSFRWKSKIIISTPIKTDLKVDEENDDSEVDERMGRRDDVSLLVQNKYNGRHKGCLGVAVESKKKCCLVRRSDGEQTKEKTLKVKLL